MRIKDFEKAIIESIDGICIDEMITANGSQVKAVYAHDRHSFFMWDEFGRGFTFLEEDGPLDSLPMDPRHEVNEYAWKRMECYDLDF